MHNTIYPGPAKVHNLTLEQKKSCSIWTLTSTVVLENHNKLSLFLYAFGCVVREFTSNIL